MGNKNDMIENFPWGTAFVMLLAALVIWHVRCDGQQAQPKNKSPAMYEKAAK